MLDEAVDGEVGGQDVPSGQQEARQGVSPQEALSIEAFIGGGLSRRVGADSRDVPVDLDPALVAIREGESVLLGREVELPETDLPQALGQPLHVSRGNEDVEVARAAEAVRGDAFQAQGQNLSAAAGTPARRPHRHRSRCTAAWAGAHASWRRRSRETGAGSRCRTAAGCRVPMRW
jgi:hypothetical protein